MIGPNASGKTDYLNSLFGTGAAFAPAAADALFAGRTVAEHLTWAAAIKPLRPIELSFPTRTRISRLSVGQRRELTLAVAFAAEEPLLLLDEPFDGLDISTRTRLRERLIEYIAADPDRTVVMSSHRAEDLAGLVEYVIRVSDHTVAEPVALDTARPAFPVLTGPRAQVETVAAGRPILSSAQLGPTMRVQLAENLNIHPGNVEVSYPDDTELIDLLAARKD